VSGGIRERMRLLRGQGAADTESSAGAEKAADTVTQESGTDALAESGEHGASSDVHGSALSPEWEALQVSLRENEHGEYLMRRVTYPLGCRHGDHRLSELAEAAPHLAAFHVGEAEPPEMERLLFLDLETTGLGVGTGNVPFMTGLAYAEDGRFVVEQALIRHPAEERAMLADLQERLGVRPYLVTYNGRTFDWPVLAGRYIMNGLGRFGSEPRHLDLLHPSRSIWRNTLTSCKLSHVEEERLGIHRVDDVPGSLAPAIYFQFLSDGRPEQLSGVFHHNELDMLALACLAVRFGRLLGGGLGDTVPYPVEPEELLRTGLWLERMGRTAEAEALFARLDGADPAPSWCLPLAARDKRCGNWQRAVILWQKAAQAANRSSMPHVEAHVELSMYYEHRAKDYASALQYASEALEMAVRRAGLARNDPKSRAELAAIRKRMERLIRKAGRNHA